MVKWHLSGWNHALIGFFLCRYFSQYCCNLDGNLVNENHFLASIVVFTHKLNEMIKKYGGWSFQLVDLHATHAIFVYAVDSLKSNIFLIILILPHVQ